MFWCGNTEYDLNNLVGEYIHVIDRLYTKGRFICATLWSNNHVRFYELRNFYVTNVASIGEMIGYKKLSFDFNTRKYDKQGQVITSRIERTYCRRDTLIVQKAGQHIVEMFLKNGIGLCATVASTALQIYLAKYDEYDLTRRHRNEYILDKALVRKSYVGGRSEVFKVGHYKRKMTYIDVNSLYPYCMKRFLYPNPMSNCTESKKDDIANGVIHATVKVPSMYIPVLPLYHNHKLMFPIGTFTSCWTVPEYRYAISCGVKPIKIHQSYTFAEEIDLFSSFVDDMYALRLSSRNEAEKKFYKIVLNCLYGKFAERNMLMRLVPIEDATFKDKLYAGQAIMETEYFPSHSHTILSAYVTSYARIVLHQAMMQLIERGCIIYYCDTDSIIFGGDDKGYIIDTKQLGGWKIEHLINEAEFRAPKYYRFKVGSEWFYRCKGVPASMQRDAFKHDEITYNKPIRWNESFRRHIKANVWIKQQKRLSANYDKRIVLSGGDTKPVKINY